jgi:hypothetical protein
MHNCTSYIWSLEFIWSLVVWSLDKTLHGSLSSIMIWTSELLFHAQVTHDPLTESLGLLKRYGTRFLVLCCNFAQELITRTSHIWFLEFIWSLLVGSLEGDITSMVRLGHPLLWYCQRNFYSYHKSHMILPNSLDLWSSEKTWHEIPYPILLSELPFYPQVIYDSHKPLIFDSLVNGRTRTAIEGELGPPIWAELPTLAPCEGPSKLHIVTIQSLETW